MAKDFCEDIEDEYAFFNEICERVIKDPRFYLDHIDDGNTLQTYKFSFIDYTAKCKSKPYEQLREIPKPL